MAVSIIAASKTSRLGTKRTCRACAARFYDFEKPEPSCPKCKAIFDIHAGPVLPALEPLSAEELSADEQLDNDREAKKKKRHEDDDEGDVERDQDEADRD